MKISRLYPVYIDGLYEAHPNWKDLPYDEQMRHVLDDGFWWADFYTSAFTNLGYETQEIIANARILQKKWAQEHDLKIDGDNWQKQILFEQIKDFKPDVLLVTNGLSVLKAEDVAHIRDIHPELQLAFVVTGAPATDWQMYRAYDFVVSNIPELVHQYREAEIEAHLVHHAFEPRLLNVLDIPDDPLYDLIFTGSIIEIDQYHNERKVLIDALMKQAPLDLWTVASTYPWTATYTTMAKQVFYDVVRRMQHMGLSEAVLRRMPIVSRVMNWSTRPAFPAGFPSHMANRIHTPVYGHEMYELLGASKLVFNTHIDVSAHSASNMRLFEVTGVGSCLVTDWKDNLPELFEPDTEVVTYQNIDECVEKVNYLLEHDDERRKIAEAGQARTLRDHTVSQRVAQLHELIELHLDK